MKRKHVHPLVMKKNLRIFTLCFVTLSLVLGILVFNKADKAQPQTKTQTSIFDQLEQDQLLEMTIETNLSALLNDRSEENEQTAEISWTGEEGPSGLWNATVRPRGKTRLSYCQFPPLKIKLAIG